jgi:hypothetical protein
MPYVVEVDLSAKVEQWSKNTAVAFSDGIQGSILVESNIKRAARDWLRTWHPNRSKAFYRYNLFAAFVYILINPYLQQIEHVVIDKDYPGEKNERLIKVFLLNFLHREDPSLGGEFISFRELRGSAADTLARRVYLGDKEADRKIAFKDIQLLFK